MSRRSKHRAGSLFVRAMRQEDRLINKIDNKESISERGYESNKVANVMTITEEGDRVWSF